MSLLSSSLLRRANRMSPCFASGSTTTSFCDQLVGGCSFLYGKQRKKSQNVVQLSFIAIDLPFPGRRFSSQAGGEPSATPKKNPAVRYTPTIEEARSMPMSMREASSEVLMITAATGDREAVAEVLRRHIMAVDNLEYGEASTILNKITVASRRYRFLYTVPNKLGIVIALTAGFASFPLVFDLATVNYFNEVFVTTQIPEPEDLETPFEVGAWSWNWMEPPLGQFSFFLLCLQFAKSQMQNIGLRPFSDMVKHFKAKKLVKEFPRYDARMLTAYSKADNYYD